MDKTAIRHAATVILLRDAKTKPRILMGQRGKSAAFMPNKFVFPGGALDPVDSDVVLAHSLSELCMTRLAKEIKWKWHCSPPARSCVARTFTLPP